MTALSTQSASTSALTEDLIVVMKTSATMLAPSDFSDQNAVKMAMAVAMAVLLSEQRGIEVSTTLLIPFTFTQLVWDIPLTKTRKL